MSDFIGALGTRIQGAASVVNQAFWNGMELQGQAEILNGQANLAVGQGVVNAFPYALQEMTSWGEAGLIRGTVIGGVTGGVIGGTAGTVTVPGVGTGVGFAGGAYVGGEAGLIFGTAIGGTAGFFHGLVTAPTWSDAGPATQNSAVGGQLSGDTGPGTQSLAGQPGSDGNGLALGPGTAPTDGASQTAGNAATGTTTDGTTPDGTGTPQTAGNAATGTTTDGTTPDGTGTYQTAGPDPTDPVMVPADPSLMTG